MVNGLQHTMGSQFLIAEQGGGEDKIVIFTTTDNMSYLSEVERI